MPDNSDLLERIRIVLVRTSHPGNIGAAARAMKTMGLKALYLVAPETFPHEQATAMASGATDVLNGAVICDSLADALSGTTLAVGASTRRREIVAEVLTPAQAVAGVLQEAAGGSAVALVFGNETFGLSNEELGCCQWLMSIPANPDYSSLNLAAAVQVVAYELRQQALDECAWTPAEIDGADLADVERFYVELEKTLIDIGFLNPASPKRLMPKLRRLFARTRLAKEELNILRGLLSAVNDTAGTPSRNN
ncbi:MAG: RNA methyltransferase [Thiobacillaceae bacterium]